MAIIDSIKFNGTDYLIGASSSTPVYSPTDIGLDLENGNWGDNAYLSMNLYPCKGLTDSTLAVISPDYGTPYGNSLTVFTSPNYTAPVTNHKIVVGDAYYRIIFFKIQMESEPETAPTSWRVRIPYSSKPNASVKIIPDIPLTSITPSYIAELFGLNQGLQILSGKKWLALGDSYTNSLSAGSQIGAFRNLADRTNMSYQNYGVNSSTIRGERLDSNDFIHEPMSVRVDSMISTHSESADDVGLITFMGGTNDGYSAEKMGTLGSTSLTTIYGSCHHIFNSLINAFPNALIIVILQPVSAVGTDTEGGFTAAQQAINGCQLKQRVVKEVAEFYGLPIVDCCFDWYTTANPNHLSKYWESDNLHLTTLGYNRLTNKLLEKIEAELVIK